MPAPQNCEQRGSRRECSAFPWPRAHVDPHSNRPRRELYRSASSIACATTRQSRIRSPRGEHRAGCTAAEVPSSRVSEGPVSLAPAEPRPARRALVAAIGRHNCTVRSTLHSSSGPTRSIPGGGRCGLALPQPAVVAAAFPRLNETAFWCWASCAPEGIACNCVHRPGRS
eukprot:COSAG03_NODE_22_length_20538_cov_27.667286_8_plen_170_part_00